mgnify:CR=1 FL=1
MDTSMESDDIIDADDVDVEPEDTGNVHSDEELDADSDEECLISTIDGMRLTKKTTVMKTYFLLSL